MKIARLVLASLFLGAALTVAAAGTGSASSAPAPVATATPAPAATATPSPAKAFIESVFHALGIYGGAPS